MVKILDYLRNKGFNPRPIGAIYRMFCPFPDHRETKPSFTIWPNEDSFHCFGCGKTGSVLKLMKLFGDPIPQELIDEAKQFRKEHDINLNPVLLMRLNKARSILIRIRHARAHYKDSHTLNNRVYKMIRIMEEIRI